MNEINLERKHIQNAFNSFKALCFSLLDIAYFKVLKNETVDYSWDENAISEAIAKYIEEDEKATQLHISAKLEKRLFAEKSPVPPRVDNLPRIDIIISGFEWTQNERRVKYYMEAKNLYCKNFKKPQNSNCTSANFYVKRYINTGVNNLLSEHYPKDTLLLGYVLIGTIKDAIAKVNQNLMDNSRKDENIHLECRVDFPHLVFGLSHHPKGKIIEHCFLHFGNNSIY